MFNYFAANQTRLLLMLFITLLTSACKKKGGDTLFRLVSAEESGVTFSNNIAENDTFNILTHEYIYNGGGVGIADFNQDGLQDIFFTGNTVPNKLYLNKGSFKFEDVSGTASINVDGRWNSGVSVVDINDDGLMDIYVCSTMLKDSLKRKNSFFINKGLNKEGVPVFENKAKEYGVEVGAYSVMSAFFDYDLDGDLDLYVLVNQRMDHLPSNYREKIDDGTALNNDRLYSNNGNGTFTDVTIKAGIVHEGFGLGLNVSDINMDGWPDVYVSNDYLSNDILYINNHDGTFTNKIKELIPHQSQFSMGNDVADFNNDGFPDIYTIDMLSEISARKKTTVNNKSYLTYINNEKFGYEYQYVRNMLQLSNGLKGEKFSEIGELSGVFQTEWSWCPLFADFDNDGLKDLVVTNGFPKDITDKDFAMFRTQFTNLVSLSQLNDSIPVVKIPNYIFKNNGDLTFADKTNDWGLSTPSFSNGASVADLDNDGDLDYVVNNINSEAFIYENTLITKDKPATAGNYIRVKFDKKAEGVKVFTYTKDGVQYAENNLYRGFLSSIEDGVHFGIGKNAFADSVRIVWPDGLSQLIVKPQANQIIKAKHQDAIKTSVHVANETTIFSAVTNKVKINYKHEEQDQIDYNIQRTLPHKFSQSGPALSVGDLNSDGLEDVIVGGSAGHPMETFLQTKNGTFTHGKAIGDQLVSENEGILLFDQDLDGDLDLYTVSGSFEHPKDDPSYQDHFYRNNGKGVFTNDDSILPKETESGSCVRAADIDADGDLDLFVGGRVIPGAYPTSPKSFIFRNDGKVFTDVTSTYCPECSTMGLITDAIWTDFNNDNKVDLLTVGEFTSVNFYKNENNKLTKTKTTLDSISGWWNSIVAADFDNDGDCDYVVGNLGTNNPYQASERYPLTIVAKDIDENGSIDPLLFCFMRTDYETTEKVSVPIHFWDEVNSQSPKFRKKFKKYRQFAKSTESDLLTPEERKGALVMQANEMRSIYIQNNGGTFQYHALPMKAQVAPLNGAVADDVNGDGNLDLVAVGNNYGNEVFYGRYDGSIGLVLLGKGNGEFEPVEAERSGFYVPGDAKALVALTSINSDLYIASQNLDSLKVFSRKIQSESVFSPDALDVAGTLTLNNGKKRKVEFNYGGGYLSQPTRRLRLPKTATKLTVTTSKGGTREIPLK